MMLYHYRPIESALLEIGKGTLHFATREELNDPTEGYVSVFWQGDKAAWEGLLRNYVCSVAQAIDLYLLQGDEALLHHRTLVVDLHHFDDVPYGGILQELGDAFLADEEIQGLARFYGRNQRRVEERELQFILMSIHSKALTLCIRSYLERGVMPREEAEQLLSIFDNSKRVPFPFDPEKTELPDDTQWAALMETAGSMVEDMRDLQYVQLGFDDDSFLYGPRRSQNGAHTEETAMTEARQHRNWMSIAVDFPKVYIAQLEDLIYPESYVVCFSGKSDDPAMWGNYAEGHRGVCLVYDADVLNAVNFNGHRISLRAKPISYGGELLECNFFESFGRLALNQIAAWLTGTNGLSSCYGVFLDEQAWRKRYWEVFDAKTYRKLPPWEHENEYRLALSNSFYRFDDRNLSYEYRALKGVIFGVSTSECDKKRIMEALLAHADELTDFTFYQAEYDSKAQRVNIREKALWKLNRPTS